MVIETFSAIKLKDMYARFEKEGRLLPPGVQYISSWIDETVTTCYQVMETDSLEKLYEWISNWTDFARFQVIPVISSAEAKAKVLTV